MASGLVLVMELGLVLETELARASGLVLVMFGRLLEGVTTEHRVRDTGAKVART